jgi:hypothetical protein
MNHPYQSLPPQNFWRSGVAERAPLHLQDLYRKRFEIPAESAVATAGSCFAQRLNRHLRQRFNFMDMEPAPMGLPSELRERFGYGMFSARYGNIYSSSHLRQLVDEALGQFVPADDLWETGGRFFDPYRPSIEPNGFGYAAEVGALRKAHLRAVEAMLRQCDIFVFTLGMTETWRSTLDGAVYPVCPGTIAETFDSSRHVFRNCGFSEVYDDMSHVIRTLRAVNPSVKFVLSVSPVPLTATATDQHVLSATTYSKSILRAVCGELYAQFDCVDYFPAYEMITAPPMRAMFYENNLRTITSEGVDYVLSHFLRQHPGKERPVEESSADDDVEEICDLEALERLQDQ